MDAVDLGRSLFAGVLARKISDTRRPLAIAGALTSLAALILSLFVDGVWRWLLIAVVIIAVAGTIAVWLLGALAMALVRRFVSAEQSDLSNAGDAVDQAVEELDLPTGPVSVIRLMWRLRRGAGEELDRVLEIGEELTARLR